MSGRHSQAALQNGNHPSSQRQPSLFQQAPKAQNGLPVLSPFQEKAVAAGSGGKAFHLINLIATAQWIAGSNQEQGTAQLQAKIDGSANVQLSLGSASRTETQTGADSSRSCQWIDNAGKSHAVLGANCFTAIPWFAPGLFTQVPSQMPSPIFTTDDGVIVKQGLSFHQVRFFYGQVGANSTSTKQLLERSEVKVLYDPQTFLPASLEYNLHPDDNDLQNIESRVVFSNYQLISGVMIPFHIEKFVNRSIQLKLDVSAASVE